MHAPEQIETNGFALLAGVYAADEVDQLNRQLTEALEQAPQDARSIRSRGGSVYASRDLLTLFPPVATAWRRPRLTGLLAEVLGGDCGLVRVLYFDKPPERSWSLPWHKDLTVAVRRNDLPSRHFSKPTFKAGVAHVEAPTSLLQTMLTLRIHLDDVSDENGPLRVIPGSHHGDKDTVAVGGTSSPVLAGRGDVLAMRPLITHSSTSSHAGTQRRRRILHLEFAGPALLPDGYQWHYFQPVFSDAPCG